MKLLTISMKTENAMKKFETWAMAAMIGVTACAGIAQAGSKGTSGGQFLRIGAGARGPGMGGAFSPVADDATAIYWNPAGLATLEKKEVSLGYNAYFKDTAAQFLGYSHPMSKGTLGVGASLFGVKNIDKRSITAGDA